MSESRNSPNGVPAFWREYFAFLLLHRLPAFILLTAFIGWLGIGIRTLDVDFNIESLFPRDDAKLVAFSDYVSIFGRDDDFFILLCETGSLESREFLEGLNLLTEKLNRLGLFAEVHSFLDAPHVWMKDEMLLEIIPVKKYLSSPALARPKNGGPENILHPERMTGLLASLTMDGPILGNFLQPGSQTAILLLKLVPELADNNGRLKASGILKDWLNGNRIPGITNFTLSGMPAARADGMRMIQNDQRKLLPISLGLTILTLLFLFGRLRDVLLVMIHVFSTLFATLGIMGHLGLKFSFLSSVTPVILVTIGSAYSIQIIARLNVLKEGEKGTSLEDVFASMIGPVFLANITTVIGFISLYNSDMRLINEFAMVTAGGVFMAFVLTVTYFPLVVAMFPGEICSSQPRGESRKFSTMMFKLGLFLTRRPYAVFFSLVAIGLVFAVFSMGVQVKAFVFDDFRPDSHLMKHIRKAEQVCRGILPMAVMIKPSKNETVLRLHFLEKAEKIASFLRKIPEVGKVDSPSDMVGRVFSLLSPERNEPGVHPLGLAPRRGVLPKSDSTLAEIIRLFLVSGTIDPGIRLVARDLSAMQIRFRIMDLDSGKAARLIDGIRGFIAGFEDERTTLRLTGTTVMIQESYRNILGNLVSGFLMVIFFTILVLAFSFRHLPTLTIGVLGNLIPMVGVIALMALMDVSFKPSTVMVFGISLGLAVDNTIYFLKEYWRYCTGSRTPRQIVPRALRKAGSGMIKSSTSLLFGFLVLLFSEFEGQFLMGLLIAFSVLVALAYDLLFVPAGMAIWGPTKVD